MTSFDLLDLIGRVDERHLSQVFHKNAVSGGNAGGLWPPALC